MGLVSKLTAVTELTISVHSTHNAIIYNPNEAPDTVLSPFIKYYNRPTGQRKTDA